MPSFETERTALVRLLRERYPDLDERVLEAIGTVPRHEFVSQTDPETAYADRPQPIDDGQTISAPHMVAIMADLLDLEPGMAVLEIGTGCGYHAAVTAELVGDEHVTSIEVSAELARRARSTLAAIGYPSVAIHVGDGRNGWPEGAPYDAIYFTCAIESVPEALFGQLRPGGMLLAPVGRRSQTLVSFSVDDDGNVERREHGGVRFVRAREE